MYKEIYLAGGCFWGIEKYLSCLPGVVATEVGYANGKTEMPTYEDVCCRHTGHAETVKVCYDQEKITLEGVLSLFYEIIDPTERNRQGNDVGVQYRTGVYFTDEREYPAIRHSLEELQNRYDKEVVVEARPLENYWTAEEYHQKYLIKNPKGYCHIHPLHFEFVKYNAKPKEALRNSLTETQYRVTQENATEPPFQNAYFDYFEKGLYVDVTTGQPLFLSSSKYESGCGWPSFTRPIQTSLIREVEDKSHDMVRTEVRSKLGNAHLGHVFEDGPAEEGGRRYCINSAALRFVPKAEMQKG